MAIWKEPATSKRDDLLTVPEPLARPEAEPRLDTAPAAFAPPRRAPEVPSVESVLGSGLSIEGKIEGTGHIRIAGRFHGDVNVHGNLAVERGAKLVGGIQAETVTVGGEIEGNITGASRVELLESGVLTGDLKAASLTVAAGSRMRGRVEFGWDDGPAAAARKPNARTEAGPAS
ncbi:MAG: polymer-forming cytoskeletal protein [Gemmatimonadota bacterium]|nr:polymer-forming cytoskeletal protein [Gemmatimonadota bacterium]MDE3172179.1 polymer-forming cytoskeletal protein [Gemmatimonadota bacterium]MDE3217358.1 polymer-forming cytoskeletal protein [Gemmatimonadota bacterium]